MERVNLASRMTAAQRALFWNRIDVGTKSQCWCWKITSKKTYSTIRVSGVLHGVHRVAYVLEHGHIPDGMVVRHTCDTPNCCNPSHLVLGTHADNVGDRVFRDRSACGERNARSKLSEDDVRAIRASTKERVVLAHRYKVSKDTVSNIRKRRSWTHIA